MNNQFPWFPSGFDSLGSGIVRGERSWSQEYDSDGLKTEKWRYIVCNKKSGGPGAGMLSPDDANAAIIALHGNPETFMLSINVNFERSYSAQPLVDDGELSNDFIVEVTEQESLIDEGRDNQGNPKNLTDGLCENWEPVTPLQERPKWSGNFGNKVSGSATGGYDDDNKFLDSQGNLLRPLSSGFSPEFYKGKAAERDYSNAQITYEKNVSQLGLGTILSMIDCLNDGPMWGLSAGQIRFVDFNFTEEWYGMCFRYYKITYSFDVRWDAPQIGEFGWKRRLPRQTSMIMKPPATRNPPIPKYNMDQRLDPQNWEKPKEGNGENINYWFFSKEAIKNKPVDDPQNPNRVWDEAQSYLTFDPKLIDMQEFMLYRKANLSLLVPASF
jgi:hypothetical protein